jgi:WD40 repeat protein
MLFSYPPGAVAWSPDGKRIALRPFDYSATNAPVKLQIVEVATQNQLASYTVRGSADVSLFWSPNGKYLASRSGEVWNATTGQHLAAHKGQPLAMVWSPNSQYLAAFNGSPYWPQSLNQQLSPGTRVDTTVHIWNALTGEDVFVYRGHAAGVNYVAWSPDGSKIASASADMTVKVWQATQIGITGG